MEELLNKIKSNKKIKKIYGLRYDVAFKNVFHDKRLLEKLISDLFHENIGPIESIRNKELVKENINFKCRVCDMVAETDIKILLAEIQNKNLKDFKKRLIQYISTLFLNQDFKGDYNNIKPVKTFLILNYKEGTDETLKEFTKFCKEVEEQFDNLMDITVWSIPNALRENQNTLNYEYANIFTLDQMPKDEAIEVLRMYLKKEDLKSIIEKIIIYHLDVKTYQKLKEEEIMEMTFEQAVSGYKHEGIKIGEVRGEQKGKLETAKNLLSAGVPLEVIIKATNLSEQQIKDYVGA